ncbi:MAG TPA: hypothetical protein VID03_03755 [Acidimicrobiia bacterium]|jgi:hypothetical protein
MPAQAVGTLVVFTLIIAAAAIALLIVIGHLTAALRNLKALTGGVEVVADKTSTVPAVVKSVNANLKPVSDFAESI